MTIVKLSRLAVLAALALSACGGQTPITPSSGSATAPGAGAPAGPEVSTSSAPGRTATLHEIVNDVKARPSEAAPLETATEGDQLTVGGQAQTGTDSKVRVDLTEGTIVRVAPNSAFTLTEFTPSPESPFAKLSLAAGQVFVILQGGALDVETPVGTATVRGSYLGVNFDPALKRLVATCLEGSCELKNDQGATLLTNGQAAEVAGEGQPPSPPRPMAPEEMQQWTAESPEARLLLTEGTPGTPGAPLPPAGGEAGDPFGPQPGGTALPPTGPDTNTQPLRYSLTNACTVAGKILHWHVKFEGPATETIDIPPGETRSGELPAGRYTATAYNDEGMGGGTRTFDSDAGPINSAFCQDGEPGGSGSGGSPPPPGTPGAGQPSGEYVNTLPLRYNLTNNCVFTAPDGTVKRSGWHWKFEGPVNTTIGIPAGESRSGELPPGRYTVSDWDDDGHTHGPSTLDSDFANISVTSCPDK